MITCKICGNEFKDEDFNGHPYKSHKVKLADYFSLYFNKRDLFSGEAIPFKSIGQYLGSDFINKTNFKSWIKTHSRDEVKSYCSTWLDERRSHKGLKFAPSQTELKTLVFPSIHYLDELFSSEDGYYSKCEKLGYCVRHNKINKQTVLPSNFTYSEQRHIIIDTREGRPLIFPNYSNVGTLGWGDYALSDETISCKVRVERKSLVDAIGTLSKAYERFSREIERAEKDSGYIVVLIEEKIENLLTFNFLPHISKRVKARPEFIVHRIRELCQFFGNLQFVCVDGRREAARVVSRIFQLGETAKTTDLQLAYDLKIL